MRNHGTHWVTGVQSTESQLSVSRSNGDLSTGTFTRVQQLNVTTQKWKWRRNLAPLLPCCGAPESGLLKPGWGLASPRDPLSRCHQVHPTQQGLLPTGIWEGDELLVWPSFRMPQSGMTSWIPVSAPDSPVWWGRWGAPTSSGGTDKLPS